MKTRRLLLLVSLFTMFGCSRVSDNEAPPEGTAITRVTVIDAENGVRENQTVVFLGDEIVSVTSSSEPPPMVRRAINGSGKFLIPGLWDMHVHLIYNDAFIEDMPSMFLRYGVTSVRDTGGLIQRVKPVVDKMRAPGAIAPRVYFAGPLLDGTFVVYDGDSRPEIGVQNATTEMARARVDDLKASGVDFIKIYEMVSPEVFEALAAAAAANDLPIAAHVPLAMVASQAGPTVDSMEHLRNVELDCASNSAALYEERLSMLAAHESGPGFVLRSQMHAAQRLPAIANYDPERCARTIASLTSTIQVPTLRLNTLSARPVFARDDWDAVLEQVPGEANAIWRQATEDWRNRENPPVPDSTFADWSLQLTGRMHAAGVPIGAGTDTPIGFAMPGYSLHTELERLVEAGLSPIEAIRSATIRPAEFLRLQDQMGTIEAGKRADLVLLDANPLDSISNTRRINAVVSAGRYLSSDDLQNLPKLSDQ